MIELLVPAAAAAFAAFVVWKIFAGVVRIALIAAIVGGGAYAWSQGLI